MEMIIFDVTFITDGGATIKAPFDVEPTDTPWQDVMAIVEPYAKSPGWEIWKIEKRREKED